ncbi:hypothetical protein [Sporosalibacterium faouarense]|uniref:hypothetical protein n=1 Tax=Sporosalibacterium faouarense TaxID=516123 RepID=UPI00192C5E6B|nr:hypothetical protein [Sporosalibacterium faouarense]
MIGRGKIIKNINKKQNLVREVLICIVLIVLFNRYSKKLIIDKISHNNSKYPLIVYKTDVDEYHNFKRFTREVNNEEVKEKVMDYVTKRDIRRIVIFLEPFFDSEFDKNRIMPRYSFQGYLRDLKYGVIN